MEAVILVVGEWANVPALDTLRGRVRVRCPDSDRFDVAGVVVVVVELVTVRVDGVLLKRRWAKRRREDGENQERQHDEKAELSPAMAAESTDDIVERRPARRPVAVAVQQVAAPDPVQTQGAVEVYQPDTQPPRPRG